MYSSDLIVMDAFLKGFSFPQNAVYLEHYKKLTS